MKLFLSLHGTIVRGQARTEDLPDPLNTGINQHLIVEARSDRPLPGIFIVAGFDSYEDLARRAAEGGYIEIE